MWFPGSKFSPPQPRPSLGKSLEGCPRMSWRITSQNRQVWKKKPRSRQFPPDLPLPSIHQQSVALSPKRSTAAEMGDTRFSTKDSWRIAVSAHPGPIHGECTSRPWCSWMKRGDHLQHHLADVSKHCWTRFHFFRKRPWIHEHPATVYGLFMIIHHSLYYGVSTFPLSMDSIWFHGQATGVQHSMELFQNLLRVVGMRQLRQLRQQMPEQPWWQRNKLVLVHVMSRMDTWNVNCLVMFDIDRGTEIRLDNDVFDFRGHLCTSNSPNDNVHPWICWSVRKTLMILDS